MTTPEAKSKASNFFVACGVVALVLCILAVCIAVVSSSSSEPKTAEEYAEEYDGSVDVYREILASTDCAFLQEKFDIAYANNQNSEPGTIYYRRSTGFMLASDNRMKEIGCYTSSNPPQTVFQPTTNVMQNITVMNTSTSYILPTLTQPVAQVASQTSEPTATIIFIFPTAPASSGGGAVCPCSGDTLNCSHFPTDPKAQACMDYCIAQGAGDIHNLDGDANGLACDGA